MSKAKEYLEKKKKEAAAKKQQQAKSKEENKKIVSGSYFQMRYKYQFPYFYDYCFISKPGSAYVANYG